MTDTATGGPVQAPGPVLLLPGERVVPVQTRGRCWTTFGDPFTVRDVQGFDYLVDDQGTVELPETD